MRITTLITVYIFLSPVYGQIPRDLTHLLMKNPIVDEGPWQDEKLLLNRMFTDGYHKWGQDSLINIFLPQVWKEKDSLINAVDGPVFKMAIVYYYANGLFDLSDGITYKMHRDEAWKIIADTIVKSTPFPDESSLSHIPMANKYLQNLARYELREVAVQSNEVGKEVLVKTFDLPMDSLQTIIQNYGETYLAILLSKKRFTTYAHERYLAHQLLTNVSKKNLLIADAIRHELTDQFPESSFLEICDQHLGQLRNTLIVNEGRSDIVFIDCPDSITSLETLLKPFRGKVVYLDIWGTWCGPCVLEISQYTQALKQEFKNRKDIVFLYLAMDSDQDHEKWEQFVKLNAVTGFHLRKNKEAIEPIWIDLVHEENTPRTYPTYAIFDRSGQLMTPKAKRPSHGQALYMQLRDVLD